MPPRHRADLPSIRKPHRRLRTAIDASRSRRSARAAPPPFEFCTNSRISTFVCNRRMQREARSCFATSTGRECTIVLDPPSPRLRRDKPPGTGARREIARAAPPPFRFFTTNGTIIKNSFDKSFYGVILFASCVKTATTTLSGDGSGGRSAGSVVGVVCFSVRRIGPQDGDDPLFLFRDASGGYEISGRVFLFRSSFPNINQIKGVR